jgi:ABC-2 type transport system permease protein
MKKFKFLVKFGLLKRIGRKSFLIANLVIAILSIAIINMPSIIALFSSDADQITDITIQVSDSIGIETLVDDLDQKFNQGLPAKFYLLSATDPAPTASDIEAFWADSEVDVLFVFGGTEENPIIEIYSKMPHLNASFANQIELQLISYQLGGAYERPVFTNFLAPDYEDPEAGMMVGSIASILVLPLFILVTMATQFVGVDIIEEKST